ncbi:hypothetical protein NIES4103_17210 [Nostoc sp. NIES-4103]|nr:hypothetical protein NIES4103_17210 [Nostoc sp. NIES-4103]
MSYLDNLRLTFAGDFQADVSTVNNDVRHFDNATFEDRFQNFQQGNVANGWWNPIGSGAYRLINCKVQSVHYQDGSGTTDATVDPAVGLFIDGSNDRVGGKLVDLDPQWQLASQIWGLKIRLTDGKIPHLLTANFEPTAFRDILFGRQEGASPGDQTAAASFQSVLTDLEWGENLRNSRFLEELKKATSDGLLSIRLATFGYSTNSTSNRFTIGTVIGAIGPYRLKEPRSFVLGRRMVPLNGQRTTDNVNFFDCRVDEATKTVFADFGNALPLIDGYGSLKNINDLQLAVLTDANTKESQQVSKNSDFIALGTTIPYREQNWLRQTSGIWAVKLQPEIFELIQNKPLALIKMSNTTDGVVVIRESVNGLLIRADNFVHRVEPKETVRTNLFAVSYGKPLADAKITIALLPPLEGQGGGRPTDPSPPKATIPVINIPASALSFTASLTTNSEGKAELSIVTTNPNNPRQYLDGQVYIIQYQLDGQIEGQQQQFDFIYLLLHDEYVVPEQPTWLDHIQPILQQYSNLYPIMSKRLVNLGNYDSVKEHRAILELAFSLHPSDPNFMPVTRDLSHPKQQTILKWLRQKTADGSYALVYGEPKLSLQQPKVDLKEALVSVPLVEIEEIEDLGGKTQFYQGFQAARKTNSDRT